MNKQQYSISLFVINFLNDYKNRRLIFKAVWRHIQKPYRHNERHKNKRISERNKQTRRTDGQNEPQNGNQFLRMTDCKTKYPDIL